MNVAKERPTLQHYSLVFYSIYTIRFNLGSMCTNKIKELLLSSSLHRQSDYLFIYCRKGKTNELGFFLLVEESAFFLFLSY